MRRHIPFAHPRLPAVPPLSPRPAARIQPRTRSTFSPILKAPSAPPALDCPQRTRRGRPMRYPRNMQGYGGNPPAADWPGGATSPSASSSTTRRAARTPSSTATPPPRLPLRDPGRPALARPAPLEHGIDLRIRRPRRLLAPPRPLRLPRRPGHRLRRRLRPRPLPRPGRRDAGRRLGDRLPRPELDRLPQPRPPRPSAPTSTKPSASTPRSPARPRAAGTPAAPRSTPSTSSPRPALFDWIADTYDDDLPYWREQGAGSS